MVFFVFSFLVVSSHLKNLIPSSHLPGNMEEFINDAEISKVLAPASPYRKSVSNISFIHINDKIDLIKQNSVLLYTSCLFGDIINDIYFPGNDFKQNMKQKCFVLIYYCSDWYMGRNGKAS